MATTVDKRPTAVEHALGMRSGERALVGWLVALFMVVQASHGLGANAADALFFQRFGVVRLPLMILLSGPAVMISVLGHGSGLAYRGASRWLPTVTLLCAGWAGAEWIGAQFDSRPVYPVIWISTQVMIMVSFTVMWNAAGAACTTRQAKRLFPIFATAGVAGGVLGNLATGPLASIAGTPNLLLGQALLLLGGSLLLIKARPLFGTDDGGEPKSLIAGISETLSTVRTSRFLRMTAVVAVALFCLFYLVYFPFSQAVASSFTTESETAAFLGVFSSIATGATFLFSLLVTNRLFSRLGLVLTLMIAPIIYGTGFGVWLADFSLASAALVRGLQWVTVNAIALTAYNALFNVVPRHRRGGVNAFMTAVPAQLGVSLGGLLLMSTVGWPLQAVFIVGLAISLATLVVIVALRTEYLGAVVAAVRQGVIGILDSPAQAVVAPTDADSVRILREHLRDPRPQARALAVAALGRLGQSASAADIEPLLTDADPRVRSAAFDSVCSIEPGRVSPHAVDAINDEVPAVRLQVVHYLAAHPEEEGVAIARKALSDPDVRVRAAAAALVGGDEGTRVIERLISEDEPRGVAAAITETSRTHGPHVVDPGRYLTHRSPLVRSVAANAAGVVGLAPSLLRPGLDDRSPRVRRATADALAGSVKGRETLMGVLATGSVNASEAALRALTPVDELPDDFTQWARREAERAAYLIEHAEAIVATDPSPARRYLLEVLEMRSRRLVQWVLVAMTTRDTRTVMPVVARGVGSADPDTRAQAIEALETIGARTVLEVLLPLLESDERAAPIGQDRALSDLSTDFDPWISELAVRSLEEMGVGDNETMPSLSNMDEVAAPPLLDTMDRVLVLQRVHMFAELDPEDLDLIARATTESTYEPAAAIYLTGEVGDEMLVVVEGSVVVSVLEDDRRRVVRVYGPGEHVGELSLLVGGPRSADVHAGDEGVRGLALSATDLLAVLEERPAVAIGMLGTLAKRLIDQT